MKTRVITNQIYIYVYIYIYKSQKERNSSIIQKKIFKPQEENKEEERWKDKSPSSHGAQSVEEDSWGILLHCIGEYWERERERERNRATGIKDDVQVSGLDN